MRRVADPRGALRHRGLYWGEIAPPPTQALTALCYYYHHYDSSHFAFSPSICVFEDALLFLLSSCVFVFQVVAGAPNVHRLLEKGGVEFVQRTGGEYKRTINILTPNTEEGIKKFEEEIELIHQAFQKKREKQKKKKVRRGD